MNLEEYRKHGKEMVDYIADYLGKIRSRRVYPAVSPGYLRNVLPASAPVDGEPWEDIFADIERCIMPGVTHWQSPYMHAYFPALNSPASLLGDMLADAINCLGFTWASSPACTELETIVMNWLGKMIGLPEDFLHRPGGSGGGGVIQTTASEATLVCLLAARTRAIRDVQENDPDRLATEINSRLVAYCSDQAHSSVEKAGLIGLVRMRYIESDSELSMRGDALLEALTRDRAEGLLPFFVCATLGTTGACAFDNLKEIGPICQNNGLWLHVDAAYAGSAFVCPEFRGWLQGVELTDSIAFNPSKWLMVHFDCTAMWVKNSQALHRTFNVDPLYLKHENSGLAIDYMHWQIPLSKRFRALKLWFVIRNYGITGLQKHIREGVRLAQKFEALVLADARFEIPAARHLGMVVFRLRGENTLTERLLKKLNSRGRLHCVPAALHGKYVIRFTVTSTHTTNEDILRDWAEIRNTANEILSDTSGPPVRVKVPLADTRQKNENFGSSLLLANSPMSPKIVNGSFAAIYDTADVFEECMKTFGKIHLEARDSPAMRRRIRGILMSGKQFSLDSRMDLVQMTNSVKEEMRRYKSQAMRIEEKLKSRQLAKHAKDKCVQADITKIDILKNAKYSSDSDISNHDTTSDNMYNSDSFSKMDMTLIESTQTKQITETRDESNIQSSMSDMQHSQSRVSLNNDIVINDLPYVVEEIHQNERINKTRTTLPNEDVALPENCKPEIPKTLDVVPLTLNKEADNVRSYAIIPKENENLPKLSRQGSYVLDTPSPCLLAHMDTDFIDKDYIPTPTTNGSQRTQWNLVPSKIEWQNKQFMIEDTKDATEHAKDKLTPQQVEIDTLTELYQTNKSSIVASEQLVRQHTSESDIMQDNQISDIDLKNQSLSEKSKGDSSISNSATKSQEFMKDNSEIQLSHTDRNKCYNNEIEDSKDLICQDLIFKTKSSTMPEKLLTVYRQIEEMHKKQIMELINRQRKEQSLLQAEFQKQQMILLAEIQKCSFEVSCQSDVPNVASNELLSNSTNLETKLEDSKREQLNVNFPRNLHAETHHTNASHNKLSSANSANVICPLDYISPKDLHLLKSHASSPLITDISITALNFDVVREANSCEVMYHNNNNSNDYNSNIESHNHSIRKNSTVNRQLFPLDSNTTHVAVLDTSAYLDKHIRAVNIINSYARGYLVRRLMRTERVITLKKIYKEALQYMLRLHVDAPLNLAEVNFLHRLQLQCDAASMNLVDLFAQSPTKRMKVIAQDREIKQSRTERPSSSRSYSFATQKTLARKNMREFESTMTKYQRPTLLIKKNIIRSRCQTWTSDIRDRLMSPNTMHQNIRRSTSAGTVRKPWR